MTERTDTPGARDGGAHTGPTLVRTMGLGALIVYGVGDMLGSGIYALIGNVAGVMGNAVWLAFLVSMIAALLTGLSYASLGSRYPRAAGAAYVTQRAFSFPFLSFMVGLAVIASGLTSMGTQSRAFARYLIDLAGWQGIGDQDAGRLAIMLLFIAVLTFVNFWGMRESTWLNFLCTAIEVTGLFIIIAVGMRFWGGIDYLETPPAAGAGEAGALSAALVLQGAVLTFYSFIGFEDMINVTEEVKDVRRTFPIAVMAALAIATVIYIAVSVTAVSVVPYRELADSQGPLVEVVRRAAPAFPSGLFSRIALFAITHTALLNYIMGSRMVYGLARQGFVPRPLGAVHPARRTPHRAILALMVVVASLALYGQIADLAAATSALLLSVFVVIHAALLVLKRRRDEPPGRFEIPAFVPVAGILVCLTLLSRVKPAAMTIAGALLVGIAVLYLLVRPKNITEETLAEAAEEGEG